MLETACSLTYILHLKISAFIYITFEKAENVKRQMYSFPRADIKNYHKLDDLK